MSNKDNTAEMSKHEDWTNTVQNCDELDAALEAGLKSGRSERTIREIFQAGIQRAKNNIAGNG